MRFRGRSVAASVMLSVLGAWIAWAQNPPSNARLIPPAAAPQAGAPTPIALVGSRSVSREEFRARETQAMGDYRERLGQEVPNEVKPAVRRQLLEGLIRRELLVLESARRGIVGSDADAEAQLKLEPFFNPDGKFDPRRLEAIRSTQPENYARALGVIKMQLGARQLSERVEREFGGDDARLKAEAARSLSRASLEFLALRHAEFDGGYREPRESEVLDAYRAGAERFRKPAEARLTLLLVDQPPLADTLHPDSPEGERWRARMRVRADSALAAARGGSRFEDLAVAVGSVRRNVTATPENFPGIWRGDARDAASVFAAKPGTLMGSPIPSSRGWLVARVEELHPSHVAPLAEVARQIRGELRSEAKLHGDDRVLREMYQQEGAKLRTTAWRIRYAAFDTSDVPTGEPGAAELDRWYRAHQADFSSFDAATGSIQVRPLAEVRDFAASRWKSERRRESVRLQSSQLADAWRSFKRDRGLERGALVREVGPLISGADVDTGLAAKALRDTLARRPWNLGAGAVAWRKGWLAYQIYEAVPNFLPSFEQVRSSLVAKRAQGQRELEEAGARALYDKDPDRFSARNVIYYTRLGFERMDPVKVPLTSADVERYYRDHLDRYAAPELVRARHILVSPTGPSPEADDVARAKAQGLLDRARRGEDFAELARRYSDDVATKERGGDLGEFGRGTMIPEFEYAAFRLGAGEMSDLVKTEVGYHIILCVSHDPLTAQPLRYIYANVGWDAAAEKAEALAVRKGDSLSVALRSPAQGRAAAEKINGTLDATYHEIGDRRGPPEIISFYIRLENTKPGSMVPGRGFDRSMGHFVAWVDSVAPARKRDWSQAQPAALDAYRRGGAERAITAKRAELDSLMAAGISFDSLATSWGGLEKSPDVAPGTALAGLGGPELTDSLIFGSLRRPPVLQNGSLSEWVELPGGPIRLRLVRRTAADPSRLTAQVENERRAQIETRLTAYFEELKKRYPVRILDERLRDTPLPPPPSSRPR